MKQRCISGALFFMLSANSFAIDGWSTGKILQLRIQAKYDRVLISQEYQDPSNTCSKADYLYLGIDDTPTQKSMYSAILSAYSAGSNIELGFTGCTSAGRAIITDIVLK